MQTYSFQYFHEKGEVLIGPGILRVRTGEDKLSLSSKRTSPISSADLTEKCLANNVLIRGGAINFYEWICSLFKIVWTVHSVLIDEGLHISL